MIASLHIGGLFAIGFDELCKYMITVSHSGRGVYEVEGWNKVARDLTVVYPMNGEIRGIGPLENIIIKVQGKDCDADKLSGKSPDGKYIFEYDDGILAIRGGV